MFATTVWGRRSTTTWTETAADEQSVQLHFSRVRPGVAALLSHYALDEGTTAFGTNRAAIEALRTSPGRV